MLTQKTVITVMKLCFSAVILQLLYISVCISAYVTDPVAASETFPLYSQIPEMLEYAAASATATLGGGLAMEYALRKL